MLVSSIRITESGVEYELKDLTLKERTSCMNSRAIVRSLNSVEVVNPFSHNLRFLQFGLLRLKFPDENWIEIKDENRDEVLNRLSDSDINELAGEIAEKTNGGKYAKKKSDSISGQPTKADSTAEPDKNSQ